MSFLQSFFPPSQPKHLLFQFSVLWLKSNSRTKYVNSHSFKLFKVYLKRFGIGFSQMVPLPPPSHKLCYLGGELSLEFLFAWSKKGLLIINLPSSHFPNGGYRRCASTLAVGWIEKNKLFSTATTGLWENLLRRSGHFYCMENLIRVSGNLLPQKQKQNYVC